MERLYPDFRALCALHGRVFEMVDPHWGMTDTVTDDHSFASVCLETLDMCTRDRLQAVTMIVRASFIILYNML